MPIPSEAARLVGQILSNIISIVLERPNPWIGYDDPFIPGELPPLVVVDFLIGDVTLFLPDDPVVVDPFFEGEASPLILYCLFWSLFLVSYTKSTAY